MIEEYHRFRFLDFFFLFQVKPYTLQPDGFKVSKYWASSRDLPQEMRGLESSGEEEETAGKYVG